MVDLVWSRQLLALGLARRRPLALCWLVGSCVIDLPLSLLVGSLHLWNGATIKGRKDIHLWLMLMSQCSCLIGHWQSLNLDYYIVCDWCSPDSGSSTSSPSTTTDEIVIVCIASSPTELYSVVNRHHKELHTEIWECKSIRFENTRHGLRVGHDIINISMVFESRYQAFRTCRWTDEGDYAIAELLRVTFTIITDPERRFNDSAWPGVFGKVLFPQQVRVLGTNSTKMSVFLQFFARTRWSKHDLDLYKNF